MENSAFKRFLPEVKDLMRKMLDKDPERRIKPLEAMQHDYFIKTGHIEPDGTKKDNNKPKRPSQSFIDEEIETPDDQQRENKSIKKPEKLTIDKMAQIEPNSTSVDEINENLFEEKKNQEPPKQIQDMMTGAAVSKQRGVSFRIKKIGDGVKLQQENYFDDDDMPSKTDAKKGKLEMVQDNSLFQSMHVSGSGQKQKLFDKILTKGKSTAKAIESDDSDEQDPELLFGEE